MPRLRAGQRAYYDVCHRNSFRLSFLLIAVVFLLRVLQHTGLSDPYVIQVYC